MTADRSQTTRQPNQHHSRPKLEMSRPIPDDIAVVGIAYRLPQDVEDDAGFWEILAGARNQASKWPRGRMNSDAHPHPRHGKVSFKNRRKKKAVPRACVCDVLNTTSSPTVMAGTSSGKIPPGSMRPFSDSRPRRLLPWIPCSDGRWRWRTRPLRMVSVGGIDGTVMLANVWV